MGWKEGYVGKATVAADRASQAGYTLLAGAPVVVDDLRTENRFSGPTLLHEHEVVSGLSVVIAGRDRAFGVLGAHTKRRMAFDQDQVHFLQAVTNVLGAAIERQRAEEAAQEEHRRTAFLAEASRILAGSREVDKTLESLARLAVTFLADYCVVYLVDEDKQIRRAGSAHADRDKEELVRLVEQGYRPAFDDPTSAVSQVIRTGNPQLISTIPDSFLQRLAPSPELAARVQELAPREALVVPLSAGGRTLGAMALLSTNADRTYDKSDLELAGELGRRAGLAVDNALLFDELQQTMQTREEFLASAAHDLKNPLTAIKGNAQLLRRYVGRDDGDHSVRLSAGLDHIDATVRRMARLVEELLDLARLEMWQPLALDRQEMDLVGTIRQAIEDHGKSTDRHRIRLDARVDSLVGFWDALRMERVAHNLLANAVKYSPEGGDIIVVVDREEGDESAWGLLQVADSGIGIPQADLERVFERFQRGRNVVGRIAGTGIGLSGSRRIIEQHGGSISVTSQEGVGTTFTIRLPLKPSDAAAQNQSSDQQLSGATSG